MKKTLDIKKLILLNMPYILLGLFATNFGEAWRMAQGADASEKFLSLIAVLPGALESFWPSLHPLDLLVGLCCGGSLRLAVYLKSKNAKKYRHGLEYGSARWGTREDIAPYVDPVFQNNVILTKTESLTMNSRPKDPKTARNKNVLVIGGSGSGKTRFWLKPNLMQMHSSYVVTDPKGTILVECGKMLQRGAPKLGKDGKPMKDKHGKVIYEPYRIKVLNTINFKKSMHYNPFAYIHSEKDILKLVTTLIANTKGEGKAGDDFWVKAETLLYFYDGMLPVTRERALELDAAGLTVYVLHEDNTESMVFDPQEIMDHGGLFGVDREEWEKSPQFHEKVMERQEHQQEREQAFLSQNRDCFAIYQVSRDDPQNVRFMNLDWLKSHDISIDRSNYDLIYTAPLRESGTVPEQLEKLYEQFNLQKPADFHSPSMSVSDIVAIKQDGKVSCHYCDSVGFTQIPGFLPENPLKNAEMAVEDDYGMIDGIINNGAKEPTVAELEQQARSGQPISLMDLAAAAHREEREKKKSVMEQLKSQPKAEHKKTAPKKSAEREI